MTFRFIAGAIAAGLTTLGFLKLAQARGSIQPFSPGTKPSTPTPSPVQPAAQPPAQPAPAPSTARVYVSNSTIYGPGASMPITDTDALWLGRAITGEVSSRRDQTARAAVAWALAQNLMLVGRRSESSRPRYSNFTDLIRAYCQPVNPMWESLESSGCRRSPSNCQPHQLERRAVYRTMGWNDLSSDVRQVVDDFRAGRLANPVPGMVDWHASSYDGAVQQIGGNHFGTLHGRRVLS